MKRKSSTMFYRGQVEKFVDGLDGQATLFRERWTADVATHVRPIQPPTQSAHDNCFRAYVRNRDQNRAGTDPDRKGLTSTSEKLVTQTRSLATQTRSTIR